MKSWLLLPLALVSGLVCAQNPGDVFVGVTYAQSNVKFKSQPSFGTFHPATLSVGVGMIVIPNLAIEGYVFDGLNDATRMIATSTTGTIQIQNGYGFNLRPYMKLGNGWGAYAKLGRQYGAQDFVVNRPLTSTTTHTTYAHTTYGLGLTYNFNRQWSVAVERMTSKSVPTESTNASTTGVGLRYMY